MVKSIKLVVQWCVRGCVCCRSTRFSFITVRGQGIGVWQHRCAQTSLSPPPPLPSTLHNKSYCWVRTSHINDQHHPVEIHLQELHQAGLVRVGWLVQCVHQSAECTKCPSSCHSLFSCLTRIQSFLLFAPLKLRQARHTTYFLQDRYQGWQYHTQRKQFHDYQCYINRTNCRSCTATLIPYFPNVAENKRSWSMRI